MTAAADIARSPVLFLRATTAVLAAAVRVLRLERRLVFDEMVRRLRRPREGEPRRVLAVAAARVTGRLLPILPPAGMGPCLKRSLILLHLWSRWGFEARLHMGVRPGEDGPEGHAWLTVDEPALQDVAGSPAGCEEAIEL